MEMFLVLKVMFLFISLILGSGLVVFFGWYFMMIKWGGFLLFWFIVSKVCKFSFLMVGLLNIVIL